MDSRGYGAIPYILTMNITNTLKGINKIEIDISKVKFKETKDFPLLIEYGQQFQLTPKTIYALGDTIYTNYKLTPDLFVHELRHLKQQQLVGVTEWVYDYLHNPERRLMYELDAYKTQLESIKDREHRNRIRIESAKTLSSDLYGNIITYEEAFKQLK